MDRGNILLRRFFLGALLFLTAAGMTSSAGAQTFMLDQENLGGQFPVYNLTFPGTIDLGTEFPGAVYSTWSYSVNFPGGIGGSHGGLERAPAPYIPPSIPDGVFNSWAMLPFTGQAYAQGASSVTF